MANPIDNDDPEYSEDLADEAEVIEPLPAPADPGSIPADVGDAKKAFA